MRLHMSVSLILHWFSTILLATLFSVPVLAADQWADNFRGADLQETFSKVAAGLAYEPYRGLLRGGKGAAASGSANSLDQSVALALAADPQVKAYRFAQGRLSPQQAASLLTSSFSDRPPAGTFPDDEFDVYRPEDDVETLEVVAEHYWLEVKTQAEGEWIALDPSFPGAEFGQAVTVATVHHASPPRALMHTVNIVLKQETGEGVRTLGGVGGAVAQLALEPFSVAMLAVPEHGQPAAATDQDQPEGGGAGIGGIGSGFSGALSGGGHKREQKEPSAQQPVETGFIAGLTVNYQLHALGKEHAAPVTQVRNDDPDSAIKRTWLEFTINSPGEPPRTFERVMYEAERGSPAKDAAGHRRYSLLVTSGEISEARYEQAWQSARAVIEPSQWRAATAQFNSDELNDRTVQSARSLEQSASLATGHLAALTFAHQSDKFSESLARRAGVDVLHKQPRLIMVSSESKLLDNDTIATEMNIDLRLDEVAALPWPGAPRGAARLFQRARGLQETALEGSMLELLTGGTQAVVTTVALMQAARDQGIGILLLAPELRQSLDKASQLANADRHRIETALDQGYVIALPAQAVVVGGRPRYGWWQTDPSTGAMIGVMQGGEHQAMTETILTQTRTALSTEQAYMLGMFTAGIGSQTLLASELLKSRGYTEAVKQRVKAQLEALSCAMCPEASIEISIGASSGSAGHTCYAFEGISAGTSMGAGASPAWCPSYKDGFACAASLLLGNLQEDISIDGPSAGGGVEVVNPLTRCD